MKFLILLAAVIAAILGSADQALAWGPGVHLAVGNHILSSLHLIAPAVAALVSKHPNAFLYGSLSADIFIGKGCKAKLLHSHNWSVGFELLDSVEADRLKAYAYGYLTHLAADIVAHNYYVPNMLGKTPLGGKMSHVYVEMEADAHVSWSRKQVRGIFERPFAEEDASLVATMKQNDKAFEVKKKIFQRSVSVSGIRRYRHSLRRMARKLHLCSSSDYLDRMLDLSKNLTVEFLRAPHSSPALSFDPIGSEHLEKVKKLRRRHPLFRRSHYIFPLDPKLEKYLPGEMLRLAG